MTSGAEPHPSADPSLVVFDAGRWFSTPPGFDEPSEIEAPLALAGEGRATLVPDRAAVPGDAAPVSLPGPVLLRCDDGRLLAWDPVADDEVELDPTDVELLGQPFPTTVGVLSTSFADAPLRLARLQAVGLVDVGPDPLPRDQPRSGATAAETSSCAPISAITEAVVVPAPGRPWRSALVRPLRLAFGAGRRLLRRPLEGLESTTARATDANRCMGHVPAREPEDGPLEHPRTAAESRPRHVEVPVEHRQGSDSRSTEARTGTPVGGGIDRAAARVRVLASWDIDTWGQPLALGSILAYARVHDEGRLAEAYDIRRVLTHEQLLDELAADPTPAVVLFSDYIWSAEGNLACAQQVKQLERRHLVVHGGPHVPKYRADCHAHFERHPYVDVAVHGEGEITLAELLVALDGDTTDLSRLHAVPGLTVRDGNSLVHTPERTRHDRLEDFPSAYLTGEFDHLDPVHWQWPSVETDRGCPYSCTFCDWGSATRSRIRMFPLERVKQELHWIAERGLTNWMINDANFGIHRRDVEIARYIVTLREKYGVPKALYVNYAKNTVKHLADIIRMLTEAGITGEGALALQTRDAATLKAIKRQNIRVDKYDELAEEFRRYGLPLVTDLIIGLPGQTVSSFLDDMQYCVDNDVTPRFFVSLNLPNAEMNDPEYRQRFGIVLGDGDVVVATNSFTRADRERMMRLRMAYRCFEHFGILRHLMRYLQWDLGIPATTVIDRVEQRLRAAPQQFPLLSWTLGYLDIFLIPPHSWNALYEEAVLLLHDEFDVARDSALSTVVAVQRALMPHRGRRFPDSAPLDHDYVAWFEQQLEAQRCGTLAPPLRSYGPGELVVTGDPIYRCRDALCRVVEQRPHELLTGPFWTTWNWELDSPLQRLVPETAVAEAAKQRRNRPAGPVLVGG